MRENHYKNQLKNVRSKTPNTRKSNRKMNKTPIKHNNSQSRNDFIDTEYHTEQI